MSRTRSQSGTEYYRQDSWIRFEGTAEHHGDLVWLKPSVDESLTLKLAVSDVAVEGKHVTVRIGASILNVSAIESDDPETVPYASSPAAEFKCDNNPTACIGAMEVCCHSGKIIGSCIGYWRCR